MGFGGGVWDGGFGVWRVEDPKSGTRWETPSEVLEDRGPTPSENRVGVEDTILRGRRTDREEGGRGVSVLVQ